MMNVKTNSPTTAVRVVLAFVTLMLSTVTTNAQTPGAAVPANRPAPTSPVTGNAATGRALYFAYSCYACHGYTGETGRAFVGNWRNLATEAGFINFLRARANQAPATPSTAMPNYPDSTLSDTQAKDIYAYIRSFKSNTPDLKNIPALNQIVAAASRPYKP